MAKLRPAVHIDAGQLRIIEASQGSYEDLKRLATVGGNGYIEHVEPHPGWDLWCDEEGLFKQAPVSCFVRGKYLTTHIVGPCLVFVRGATMADIEAKVREIVTVQA